MTTPAGNLLRRAAEIVDGARNSQHGDKERSFECIAEFWEIYLKHRGNRFVSGGKSHQVVNSADVAAMQVLLKLARYLYGEPIEDHFIDMAGYSAILGELEAELPNEPPTFNKATSDSRCVGPDRDSS